MANLFTGSYLDYLPDENDPARNTSIQDALDAHLNGLSGAQSAILDQVAFMVVAATDQNHPWGGHRHHEQDYSASLLKIAALYTAYELRRYARDFIDSDGPGTAQDFYSGLDAASQPEIDNHSPSTITTHRYPGYPTVLDVAIDASGTLTTDFTDAYRHDLWLMAVQSDDPASARCIHGLGFGYLNAKLADDGFFSGAEGMWLAGDYVGTWPAVRIQSMNDGPSAQCTSAWDLAKALTILHAKRLVTEDDSVEMLDLLRQNKGWMHYTHPPVWPSGSIDVYAAKVGVGSLKPPPGAAIGQQVLSEGLFVYDSLRDLEFVVVWQNLQRPTTNPDLTLVAGVIEAAIAGYAP
jgi:hypothetical protein